ncbi:MAG: hypothetical protein AB7N71_06560 [Phycisphaerae bacterium]
MMVELTLRADYDRTLLLDGNLRLGCKSITLLFNAGTYTGGGGECLIVLVDGVVDHIDSADLIHDLPAYTLSRSQSD